MQKLNSLQGFVRVAEDQSVTFTHSAWQAQARQIKMSVNAPQAINLYVTRLDQTDAETGEIVEGHEHFLAHVAAGSENLEFYYQGTFALNAVGGAFWLNTIDSSQFVVEATDDTSFARVWEREEEDPAMLEMKRLARHNQRILDEQRAADRAEREAFLAEIQKLRGSDVVTPPNPGNAADQSAASGSSAVGASGDQQAPASVAAGGSGEPNAGA